MEAKQFNILTFNGFFVDETRLHIGIYETTIPALHFSDVDIDSLIHRAEFQVTYNRVHRSIFDVDRYKENIQECEMKTFNLSGNPSKTT